MLHLIHLFNNLAPNLNTKRRPLSPQSLTDRSLQNTTRDTIVLKKARTATFVLVTKNRYPLL
jgi:hypothetical protein